MQQCRIVLKRTNNEPQPLNMKQRRDNTLGNVPAINAVTQYAMEFMQTVWNDFDPSDLLVDETMEVQDAKYKLEEEIKDTVHKNLVQSHWDHALLKAVTNDIDFSYIVSHYMNMMVFNCFDLNYRDGVRKCVGYKRDKLWIASDDLTNTQYQESQLNIPGKGTYTIGIAEDSYPVLKIMLVDTHPVTLLNHLLTDIVVVSPGVNPQNVIDILHWIKCHCTNREWQSCVMMNGHYGFINGLPEF